MSQSLDRRNLGPSVHAAGTTFRVRSRDAKSVHLCLVDGDSETRLAMERDDDGVWSTSVAGLGPGARYGFRADGPNAPGRGLRFDVAKLLLDPYARAVSGPTSWHPDLAAASYGVDSARSAPLSLVTSPEFDWRQDRPPRTPWEQTVIYEAHVKGLTRKHPAVEPDQRGTYLGLAHPAVIEHLLGLGITAVELLPVQQAFTERHLVESGLTNYWGYNPLAWFAPSRDYAARSDPARELKEAVRRLHEAGLEVLLDVVFNHTAEGGADGPTLSWRGLDNRGYYRLDPADPSRYLDYTGCGNTVDSGNPDVVSTVIDCLRYWVEEFHVDGFRFDLAVSLGRGSSGDFEPRGPFFEALAAEPALAATKLIAEPWDLGPDGHQLGRFPPRWREWNDRFRDRVRRFALNPAGIDTTLERRLAGSPDIFGAERAEAPASINFVTSHDGFTLADVVSYDERHNEANGEGNRDGHAHEVSSSHGVEGETTDPEIRQLRRRATRRMLALLALARGVPMLSHGDELGRSQLGNNNAYCQDNEVSWVDWSDAGDDGLARLWVWLLSLRRRLYGDRARDVSENARARSRSSRRGAS